MANGSHVKTGYTDSQQGRMVTLEELIKVRQMGLGAIDDLIQAKDDEHPVISWDDQFDIMMLPPL